VGRDDDMDFDGRMPPYLSGATRVLSLVGLDAPESVRNDRAQFTVTDLRKRFLSDSIDREYLHRVFPQKSRSDLFLSSSIN